MPDRAPFDELYVGYLPVPARQRRFLRWVVPALLWALCGVCFSWTGAQHPPAAAAWDQSRPVRVSGRFIAKPYPMLAAVDSDGQSALVLLVEMGKRGSTRPADTYDGKAVTVSGWPLHRDGRQMIELEPGDDALQLSPDQSAHAVSPAEEIGRSTLRGEIVDSKCFLGAMKPGEGKTHKACATLCIRGGIPPMFVVRDGQGRPVYYLLRDPDGGPVGPGIEPFIADPVEATGDVTRCGGLLMLSLRPSDIRRL